MEVLADVEATSEPFAPITPEEAASTANPKKPKSEKVPILPVPADAPPCTFKVPALGGAPKRMWEYRDAEGRLLGYDARFEYVADGKKCKDVLPLTFCQIDDKQAWRSKAFPAPRPLYGLDRLAARPDAPVVVAEGAKSADAAGELLPDYVAVSWQGGANAISHSDWSPLAGRDVLIWPDRDRQCELSGPEKPYEDQPGAIAAENIVRRIADRAASVRVLDLKDWDCADGWDADDACVEGWTPEQAASFVEARAVAIDTNAPGTVLPYRFEYSDDGLYYVDTETQRTWICGRIKVLAKTRDTDGGSWGLLMEWRDGDGMLHRWAMPKAMLAGDGSAVREELFSRGLDISTESKAKGYLLRFLASVDTPVRARAVGAVGWSGNAFALPHTTIGDTATERVIFQNPSAGVHHYSSAGDLSDWQRSVAMPAIGNSRLVFMISAAFVGPILAPACEEGGGVNMVGASSTGKTSALKAAASVWGPPSFMRTWRATGNGLEGVAAQHSETLLCLDELGQLEPREAGSVAYMLGNGQGKQRASRTGGSRAAATWNVMYLSTGEVGLADLAREGKGAPGRAPQAGQEVRILDVAADAGKGMGCFEQLNGAETAESFSRQIKSAAAEYYGTAAPAFIAELIDVRTQIGDIIAAAVADFSKTFVIEGADGQVIRAARRFGLVAAAGELAIALGILPWPKGEATGAAGVMYRSWISRRGGIGSAEDRNILDRLRLFLQTHGDSRFAPLNDDNSGMIGRAVVNRAGYWRNALSYASGEGETIREYLFMPESWREVFAGFEIQQVNRLLVKANILISGSDGKASQPITTPDFGKKRCYVVSAGALGDGE